MRSATLQWLWRHREATGHVLLFIVALAGAILLPKRLGEVAAFCGVLAAAGVIWARTPLKPLKSPPHESIREHCLRVRAWWLRIVVPVLAAWMAAVDLYVTGLTGSDKQMLALGGVVAGAVIAWVVFLKDRLRCPRCGTYLAQQRAARLRLLELFASYTGLRREEGRDACPVCRVSFEEPWS